MYVSSTRTEVLKGRVIFSPLLYSLLDPQSHNSDWHTGNCQLIFWGSKKKKRRNKPVGHTVDSEYVMIKKSAVWKNRLVFNNNLSVWLAVLIIQPGANMTEVDELLNQLATDKATLPVRLPVCVLVVNRL